MMDANIVALQKSNGLCRVFQPFRVSPVANYGYMMNNAEDYRRENVRKQTCTGNDQ